MPTEEMIGALRLGLADPLNAGFALTVAAVAFLFWAVALAAGSDRARSGPGVVTTIGVLGTFVGIYLGLVRFDVADIGASVPALLEGMKTAFLTSVIGMAAALGLRLVAYPLADTLRAPFQTRKSRGEAAQDPVLLLSETVAEMRGLRADLPREVGRVAALLGGDGDSSVVTQLQKLRAQAKDEASGICSAVEAASERQAVRVDAVAAAVSAQERQLTEATGELRGLRQDLTKEIGRVATLLGGEGDSSVVTQLQKLRAQAQDEARELRRTLDESSERQASRAEAIVEAIGSQERAVVQELREVARTVADANVKALMDALKETIREFNEKLAEQFGENFKQLNAAVGQLLVWQEEYRGQVERSVVALEAANGAITASASSVELIGREARAMTDAAAALRVILESASRNHVELEARLAAFATLGARAEAAMPQIEARLDEMTTGLGRATQSSVELAGRMVREAIDAANTLGNEHAASFAAQKSGFDAMRKAATDTADGARQAVEKQFQALDAEMRSLAQRLGDQAATHLQSVFAEQDRHFASILTEMRTRTHELADSLAKASRETVKLAADTSLAASEEAKRILAEQAKSVAVQQASFEAMRKVASDTADGARQAVETQMRTLDERLREASRVIGEEMTKAIRESQDRMRGTVESTLRQTGEQLNQQIVDFDTAMGNELTKAINMLGQRLTGLSQAMVDDYTALATRFREMAEVAKQARSVERAS